MNIFFIGNHKTVPDLIEDEAWSISNIKKLANVCSCLCVKELKMNTAEPWVLLIMVKWNMYRIQALNR